MKVYKAAGVATIITGAVFLALHAVRGSEMMFVDIVVIFLGVLLWEDE